MTKKNVILLSVIAVIALTIVTAVLTNQPETLSECDVYTSFENAKSVFGGYVPEYCKR